MLKSGRLPTIKALIERYVQKVTINDENIEVEYNIFVNSRVVTYPADIFEKREIPQIILNENERSEAFNCNLMLATYRGEREIRTPARLLTTYPLSRRAPSTTWVFLQITAIMIFENLYHVNSP